jgi:hypothetical protein
MYAAVQICCDSSEKGNSRLVEEELSSRYPPDGALVIHGHALHPRGCNEHRVIARSDGVFDRVRARFSPGV